MSSISIVERWQRQAEIPIPCSGARYAKTKRKSTTGLTHPFKFHHS